MSFYSDLFRKGWAAFRRGWKLILSVSLLMILPGLIYNIAVWAGVLENKWPEILLILVLMLIELLFVPGVIMIWLKLLRNEPAELRVLVDGLHYIGKYLRAGLLLSLMLLGIILGVLLLSALLFALFRVDSSQKTIIGLIVWILAGACFVWLLLLYGMFSEIGVDQDTSGAVETLRHSREIVRGHRLHFLGLLVILAVPGIPISLLIRSQHPAVIAICFVLSFAVSILNYMLTTTFYETIRPVRKMDPGIRKRLRKERRQASLVDG